jgi:hypothetical protein
MSGFHVCFPRNDTVQPSYIFPKQNYNVLSPNSYTCISVRDLYIYSYFQGWYVYFAAAKYVDRSWEDINRSQTLHVEIRTEAAQFPEKEHINGIFVAVYE